MNSEPAISAPVLVLIVEDEILIRMAAIDALTDAGFACLEAGQSAEALEHLVARAEEVVVVCTDVHMPGEMDGVALAHHTSRSWPWISVLVMSGKAALRADDLPAGSRFLPKPYDPETLVAHVRELAHC